MQQDLYRSARSPSCQDDGFDGQSGSRRIEIGIGHRQSQRPRSGCGDGAVRRPGRDLDVRRALLDFDRTAKLEEQQLHRQSGRRQVQGVGDRAFTAMR